MKYERCELWGSGTLIIESYYIYKPDISFEHCSFSYTKTPIK